MSKVRTEPSTRESVQLTSLETGTLYGTNDAPLSSETCPEISVANGPTLVAPATGKRRGEETSTLRAARSRWTILRARSSPNPTLLSVANVPAGGKKSLDAKLSASTRLSGQWFGGEIWGAHVLPLSSESSVKISKKLSICVRAVERRFPDVRPVDARVGLSLSRTPPPRSIERLSISVSNPPEPSLEGDNLNEPVQAPVHPANVAPPSSEISPEQRPCEVTSRGVVPVGSKGLLEENCTASFLTIGPPPAAPPANCATSSAKKAPERGG